MHRSKVVKHSGTSGAPALWHSVLKLKQVTRFAVALVMHTIAFDQYSFDVRAALQMSRTGKRLGLFRVPRLGVLLPPGHFPSRNPRGNDIGPVRLYPPAEGHLIYLWSDGLYWAKTPGGEPVIFNWKELNS